MGRRPDASPTEKAAAAPLQSQLPKAPPLQLRPLQPPTEQRRRSSSSVGSGKVAVPRPRAKTAAALTAATPTALALAKPATCAANPTTPAAVATRRLVSTPSTAATPAAIAIPAATPAMRAEHAKCVASGDVDAAAAAGLKPYQARITQLLKPYEARTPQRKLVEKAATLGSLSPQKSAAAAAAAAATTTAAATATVADSATAVAVAVESDGVTRVGRRRDSSSCSCAVPAATPPARPRPAPTTLSPARRDAPDPQHPSAPSAGVFGAPLRVHLDSPLRKGGVRLRAVLKEERATDEKVEAALAHAGVHAEAEAVAARRLQAVARGHHVRAHKEEWHPEMKAAAAAAEAEKLRQRASELSQIEEARQAERRR